MAYGFNEDKEKVQVYSADDIGLIVQQLMLNVYPIGAIYMSADNTDPSELFGGTWVRWGAGRVPVSVSEQDTNFNTVEKTGGASAVTLSMTQIPAHNHTVPRHTHTATAAPAGAHTHHVQRWQATSSTSGGTRYLAQGDIDNTSTTSSAGEHTHDIVVGMSKDSQTGNTGGSAAHSNLQPYITCYMWKRTA